MPDKLLAAAQTTGKTSCYSISSNNSVYPTNARSLLCKILYGFANMFRSRGIIIRASYNEHRYAVIYYTYKVLFSMWLCYKCIVCTGYVILKMYHSCPPCAFCVDGG
jgi:hypothetical protein